MAYEWAATASKLLFWVSALAEGGSNKAVTPDKILSNLYSIGFIGVLNGGSTAYYYQTSGERRVEPTDSAFVIHPCFRQAIQSTSAFEIAAFSPIDRDELKRERFIAQERPHLSFDPYEAPRAFRSVSYIESGLEELRVVTLKSVLPDEIRSEVLDSVRAMQQELAAFSDGEDPTAATRTTDRVFRHLTVMSRKLTEHQWLGADRELGDTLSDLCSRMERLQLSGDIGSYGSR